MTEPASNAAPAAPRGFPRTVRLLLPASFKACFESGQRLSGRFFRVHFTPTEAGPRLGLAVSRKVSPRAVVRNRIKRAARESFRHHRGRLPPFDIVLLAKREAADAGGDALRADLAALWRRLAALMRPEPRGTMRADSPGTPPRAASPMPAPAQVDPSHRSVDDVPPSSGPRSP